MYPLSPWSQRIVLAVSALIALSAAGGIVVSLISDRTVWFLLAFESVVLLGSCFGVLVGRGRFATGPALAILFVAGSIGGASLLGFLAAKGGVTLVNVRLVLVLRAALIAVLLLVAALAVLTRRPALSRKHLTRGLAFAGLFVGTLAIGYFARAQLSALPGPAKSIIALIASLWLLGVLAPATHYIIRAFEAGRLPDRIEDERA